MLKKQSLIIIGAFFASCHSHNTKVGVQPVQTKDTVKAVVQKEDKKKAPDFLTPIDTIIGKDTIKVYWYKNGCIKCFLNSLSDSITNHNVNWDVHDTMAQLDGGLDRIIVPCDHKTRKFLLNDKLVLISLVDWKGRANLFMLNRTKTSLKFAKEDDHNPICEESLYIYVDLKNNIILDHGRQEDNNSDDSPYWIYRFQITNKHLVQTKLDALFFKEFLKIDVDDSAGAWIFYDIIAHPENRKHNKPAEKRKKTVSIDTYVGKSKLKVYYDDNGNIVCTLNGACDTVSEDQLGYKWQRNIDFCRIIVPDEEKPRSYILNDSILLFTLLDSTGKAELYLFNRRNNKLDTNTIADSSSYIYVDLKRNYIINYVESGSNNPHNSKGLDFWLNRYKIINNSIHEENYELMSIEGELPSLFENSQNFYGEIERYDYRKRKWRLITHNGFFHLLPE